MCMQKIVFFFVISCISTGICAQRTAIKTNLLQWGTASPNFGAEFTLDKHWSLNIEAAFNPFQTSRWSARFVTLSPEIRFWTGRSLSRHFIGIAGGIGKYDLLYRETRRNGNALTAGVTYGYNFVLNEHWNLELTAGAGVVRYSQFRYETNTRRPEQPETGYTAVPIKLGVSFVYLIR